MFMRYRETYRTIIFVSIGLLILGVLALGGQTTWAAPNAQGTAGPTPEGGGTLGATIDFTVTVPLADAPLGTQLVVTPTTTLVPLVFPVGSGATISVTGGVTMTMLPFTVTVIVPVTTGAGTPTFQQYTYRGHAYALSLLRPDGIQTTGVLTAPLTVAIRYTADDLAAAGGNPDNLAIMLFDPATGVWTLLPTYEIHPVTGWISARMANLPRGAVVALFAKSPSGPLVFPVGGGATISVTADLTITVPSCVAPLGTQLVVAPSTSLFLPSFMVTATTGAGAPPLQQYTYRAHAYALALFGPDATAITGALCSPLTVAIRYTAADLAAAGGNPNNFVIMLFNPATGVWTALPTFEVDPVTGWIRSTISNLPPSAVMALFAKSP